MGKPFLTIEGQLVTTVQVVQVSANAAALHVELDIFVGQVDREQPAARMREEELGLPFRRESWMFHLGDSFEAAFTLSACTLGIIEVLLAPANTSNWPSL